MDHERRPTAPWLAGVLVALLSGPADRAAAGDWPQFRGAARTGVAREADLLETWDEGRPEVVWRRQIGPGYSSVTVVGDRLFTMDSDGEHERVLALEAATGEQIWAIPAGPFVEAELGDGGPRSTPTVADGAVYAVSSQSVMLALDADDGSTLWTRDLKELGPNPRFGYSMSPLVVGEAVLVEVGDADASPGVIALDRETGETRWSALEGPAAYSSPVMAKIAGVPQILLFRRAGQEAVALSLDGEVLWRHPTPEALSAIAMPVFFPPDKVFVSTSEDAMGGRMLRITREGDDFHAEEIWSERLMRNHFNTSVLVDGFLYGFDNGTLRCLDAETGERRWAKRGFGKGSVVAADGLLFVLSDAGLVALAQATPEGYREAGRLQAMEGRSWTAPSLAGGRLYLRDFDEIVSLDVGGDRAPEVEITP